MVVVSITPLKHFQMSLKMQKSFLRNKFIENPFYSSSNTECFPLPVAETFTFFTFTTPPA